MPEANRPPNGQLSQFSTNSVAPLLLFLLTHRLAGLRWAIGVATLASIVVLIERRRSGLTIGRFMPVATAYVIGRGLIGVITDSETVYFGVGIATKFIGAAALVVSVAAARPLAALAAPYVMDMPPGLAKHSVFRSTMAQITLIAALYYLISASFDVWLLQRSSVEGFVLLRFLASWPLAAAALVAIATVARSRLQQIPGVISVSELIERRMSGLSGTPKAS